MIPLLSICIPTRNRSHFLKETLDCIVREDIFNKTTDVEVVISDNCSDDKTENIVHSFVKKYPDKIRYYRNDQNIKDRNFELALSRGRGSFLKLHNDNLCFQVGALTKIVTFIKSQQAQKNLLFFLNGNTKTKEEITICPSVDETLSHVSYYITWIGGFGLWKSDFEKISDFSKYAKKNLAQTEVFLRFLLEKKCTAVYNPCFLEKGHVVCGKSGYNVAEVFGKNYLSILKEAIKTDGLSQKVYEQEKKRVLFEHIIDAYFDFQQLNHLNRGHYWQYMSEYHRNLYFYLSFLIVCRKKLIPYRLIWRFKIFIYTYILKNDKKASKYRRKLK